MEFKTDTQVSEEAQWFLDNIQKMQEGLAKELRLQLVIMDDKGNLITEPSHFSTVARLIKKSQKGRELYNQAFDRAENLITAHSDPVLIKVFDGLASFWAPVATAKGKIIGSVVGGGGPFVKDKVDPEDFESKLEEVYNDLGLKEEGVSKEDLLSAIKTTPAFSPDVLERKLAELGRTVGILAEETDFGRFFHLTPKKAA